MAKLPWAPEVFNCNAPVTGNMELLGAAANEEQRQKWLRPLLEGEWQSCFAATLTLNAKRVKNSGQIQVRSLTEAFNESTVTNRFVDQNRSLDAISLPIEASDRSQQLKVNVIEMVRAAVAGGKPAVGFLLETDDRVRAEFDSKEAVGGTPASLHVLTGDSVSPKFAISVVVRSIRTGEIVPRFGTDSSSSDLEVIVEGSGENCVGSFTVTSRDTQLEVISSGTFELSEANGMKHVSAPIQVSTFGFRPFNVSATCHASTLNTIATGTTSFVPE